MDTRITRFSLGQVVRHRVFPFRGVIFDVDPQFSSDEGWWLAIPHEMRPMRDQPFYHLFAENAEGCYTAYVSEANLLADPSGPVEHPAATTAFGSFEGGAYRLKASTAH